MAEISIIVPIYQAEKTLNRCIDSILAQTYTDFELLLIDDGSTDNSPLICDEYAKKDNRIKVIHKENAGVSAARNTGIEQATSKFVMFCDSDDAVTINWCEELHTAICKSPSAFVMCKIKKVYDSEYNTQKKEGKIIRYDNYYEVWRLGGTGSPNNKIYTRSILKENNIRFDKNVKLAEDTIFNADYYKYTSHILYIDAELYFYFDTPNSLIKVWNDNFYPVVVKSFTVRLPLIPQESISDFCDDYLPTFISWLDYVFIKTPTKSFFQKLKYDHMIVSSKEFQFCLHNATGKKENKLIISLLKTKLYLPYYFVMKYINRKNNH